MLLVLLNFLDILDRDCVELVLEQLDAREREWVGMWVDSIVDLHGILHFPREGALRVEQFLLLGFLGCFLLLQGCLSGGFFGGMSIALFWIFTLKQHVQGLFDIAVVSFE